MSTGIHQLFGIWERLQKILLRQDFFQWMHQWQPLYDYLIHLYDFVAFFQLNEEYKNLLIILSKYNLIHTTIQNSMTVMNANKMKIFIVSVVLVKILLSFLEEKL